MENRYLPGMLYWEKAGQSVWRMYDQLLEIKVLAFRAKEGQQEQLYQMARKLERLNLLDEHFVKILAVKKINEEWFLLFSAKDAEEKKQQIQAVLAAKDLQETGQKERAGFAVRHDSEWSISGFGLCRDRRFRDCISLSGSVSETTYRCEGIFSGTVGGAGEFLCFCKVFGQAECISLWSSVFLRRGKDDGKIFKYTAYRHNL